MSRKNENSSISVELVPSGLNLKMLLPLADDIINDGISIIIYERSVLNGVPFNHAQSFKTFSSKGDFFIIFESLLISFITKLIKCF